MMFSALLIILAAWFPLVRDGLGPQSRSDEAKRLFAAAREAVSRSDWTTAERDYLLLIEADPGWAEAIVNLGIVYNREGKSEEAIGAFRKAIEADAKLFGAHLNLGITYFRLHRFDDAEAPLRQAAVIDPENDQ